MLLLSFSNRIYRFIVAFFFGPTLLLLAVYAILQLVPSEYYRYLPNVLGAGVSAFGFMLYNKDNLISNLITDAFFSFVTVIIIGRIITWRETRQWEFSRSLLVESLILDADRMLLIWKIFVIAEIGILRMREGRNAFRRDKRLDRVSQSLLDWLTTLSNQPDLVIRDIDRRESQQMARSYDIRKFVKLSPIDVRTVSIFAFVTETHASIDAIQAKLRSFPRPIDPRLYGVLMKLQKELSKIHSALAGNNFEESVLKTNLSGLMSSVILLRYLLVKERVGSKEHKVASMIKFLSYVLRLEASLVLDEFKHG